MISISERLLTRVLATVTSSGKPCSVPCDNAFGTQGQDLGPKVAQHVFLAI